ncbi:MAG: hypothetical protein LBB43_07635 [Spirochaetaceae bacterium]|nr:hypothetical protein [Spirochaetaceae bacterium]
MPLLTASTGKFAGAAIVITRLGQGNSETKRLRLWALNTQRRTGNSCGIRTVLTTINNERQRYFMQRCRPLI